LEFGGIDEFVVHYSCQEGAEAEAVDDLFDGSGGDVVGRPRWE
jgi:hypothetical protein